MKDKFAVAVCETIVALVQPQWVPDGGFVDAPFIWLFNTTGSPVVVHGVEAIQALRNACNSALNLPEAKP